MHLEARTIDLKLTTPFRMARSVRTVSPNVLLHIKHGEFTGYGEASPSEYYGENPQTVLACLETFAERLGDDPFALEDVLAALEKAMGFHASAKAAIDMALYDLVGKILGVPLYKLFGLTADHAPSTSFTLGIDTPVAMAQKALQAQVYPILKVKVGTSHDIDNLKAIRDVSSATIRVDANARWTPKEAIRMITALEAYTIEFVEQPTAAHDLAGLKFVRDNVSVPVFADESCVTVADIPRLAGVVDGINIKLMKCGGIRQALKMITVARAHNLRVMLGCMIESSLAITAMAHLSPLVDYADLDGHLLIENDPFEGVTVTQGRLQLPTRPGLGVQERA